MDVGPRMDGHRWVWACALPIPGGGSSGCCWSVGASVLAVLAASDVGAVPRRFRRGVPLVLLMVRVVDVMLLLMPMVVQVLYRVMPGVRALWVVMLRSGAGVASDAVGGEGAVGVAPGVAVAEVVLLVVLWLMVLLLTMLLLMPFTVSLVIKMMRVLQVVLVWVRVWAVFGLCLDADRLCSRLGAWWVAVPAGPVGGSGDAHGEGVP